MDNIELLIPPVELKEHIERLYKITGFVTILHEPEDSRSLVFSRFYHVRRVVWLAQFIAQNKLDIGENPDIGKVIFLAWAHDLNRWPFAHNSEKGLFIQEDDIYRYMVDNGLDNYLEFEPDLNRIIAKEYRGLSFEGRITLLADMLTGFIEDPLWITTALNIKWDIIPFEVAEYLGIPVHNKTFLEELYQLNLLFYKSNTHIPVISAFDTLFQKLAAAFVLKEDYIRKNPLGEPYFEEKRLLVKEQFMRKVIFSYNNEKISMGTTLKNKLIKPFISNLDKKEINKILTTIDEEQFVDMAIDKYKIISRNDIPDILPRLNYIEEFEPHMSFRTHYLKTIL